MNNLKRLNILVKFSIQFYFCKDLIFNDHWRGDSILLTKMAIELETRTVWESVRNWSVLGSLSAYFPADIM